MIEAHLKGLARRYRTQDTCIQCRGVCVLVSSNYKPVEVRTQCPWHLPLPYNRKEVTLLFVALIRNKSLSTWVRKATGENPAKKPAICFGHLKPLFIIHLKHMMAYCALCSQLHLQCPRGVENYLEMVYAGYHSNANLAPYPVHILG